MEGQWHSAAYGEDPEHGFQNDQRSPSQPPVQMQSPGKKAPTPGLYNPPASPTKSGPFGIFAVLLRIAQILFSLIGFAVMAANKDTITEIYESTYFDTYTSYSYTVKFTAVKSYVGLLSLDTIVCFYAIVQLVISIVQKATQGSFISSPTAGCCMITFIFDMVLAHALGAGCGAAADSAAFLGSDSGSGDLKVFCDTYGKFCDKADASVAISFIALAFLCLSASMYPVRLFQALQRTKGV